MMNRFYICLILTLSISTATWADLNQDLLVAVENGDKSKVITFGEKNQRLLYRFIPMVFLF